MCVANLRAKFPQADVIVVKILPCHAPGVAFYEDIRKTNAALEALNLGADPRVTVLDLTSDFTAADGSIKKPLFTSDGIHLSPAGYAVYADRLKPHVLRSLGVQPLDERTLRSQEDQIQRQQGEPVEREAARDEQAEAPAPDP
jgi:hypothetical protein